MPSACVARVTEARGPAEPEPQLPVRLRALFVEHASFVSRSLCRLGVDKTELDDAIKRVFSIAYREPVGRQPRLHARAWLYSICARIARPERRWRLAGSPEVLGEEPAAAEPLERSGPDAGGALRRLLLNELPPLQREVFVLYEVENMPLAEVAEALGCSVRRTRSCLRAARERVLAEVERMAAECDDE